MSSAADEEMKKAFIESQMRLQDLSRQLASCKAQIFQRDRDGRMAQLTAEELKQLEAQSTEGMITYKAVGKMFLQLQPVEIQSELKGKSDKCKREVNVLEKTKEYLEKGIKEHENTLKEILKRRM